MIYHKVEPRTEEWKLLRVGIPCSSEFHKIITPKTQKLSDQSSTYMDRLLYEWITGIPEDGPQTEYMQRGHEMEDESYRAYEGLMGIETDLGGFITTDDGMVGCSPDRLVGEVGDVELKNPSGPVQVKYARTGVMTDDYKTQLQGRLWIHGREWIDIFPYHPRLIIPPTRIYREDDYIAKLSAGVLEFVERMLAARLELEQRFGPFIRDEKLTDESAPDEVSFLGTTDEDIANWIEATRA